MTHQIESIPKNNEEIDNKNNKNTKAHKGLHDGAIIWVDCDPQAGHEQAGRRPALIVSNDIFNSVIGFRFVLPITHTERKNPFHVKLEGTIKTDGYIMCDQLKSLDVKARNYEYIEDAPKAVIEEVKQILIDSIKKE